MTTLFYNSNSIGGRFPITNFGNGPCFYHNEVLSKNTSARHHKKVSPSLPSSRNVALSTVIPQCRSAGYNVVFFPAIPRTETLRGDAAGEICRSQNKVILNLFQDLLRFIIAAPYTIYFDNVSKNKPFSRLRKKT